MGYSCFARCLGLPTRSSMTLSGFPATKKAGSDWVRRTPAARRAMPDGYDTATRMGRGGAGDGYDTATRTEHGARTAWYAMTIEMSLEREL